MRTIDEKKGFSFLRSFYDAAKELQTKEEQADFLMAICNYALNGTEPQEKGTISAMFKLVKPNIDTSLAKAAAGSKGGRSTRQANESNNEANDKQNEADVKQDEASEKQTQANDKQNEESAKNAQAIKDIGYRIKDIGEKEKDKKEKASKHKHGQYKNVLLTDLELQKLQTEFPQDWQQRIEKVSEYCASHGKTYTNYLATIRNWARRDMEEAKGTFARNDAQAGFNGAMSILGEDDEQS